MKVLSVPLVLLLVVAFIITGCSNTSPATQPAATTPAATTIAATTPAATTPAATTKPATTTPGATTPAATTPAATPTTSARYGGILKQALAGGNQGTFGAPWENALSPSSTQTISAEALLQEQSDGSLTTHLATSYEIKSDPPDPSITFTLRKGVKFHDGTDFNAKAVQFNLQMWKDGNMATGTTNYWKSIDVIDDYTVRVNLTEWRNYFLRVFGDSIGLQVSPTAYNQKGAEWLRANSVSTSAFIQTKFVRDVAMEFVKNPNYWDKGKPYLDGIQQMYVADDMTRQSLLKSGGAQMIDCNNNNRVAFELQNAGYNVHVQPASGFYSLVPDSANANSPWSKIKVREAADYAIDQDALARAFGYTFDVTANQYYPPGSPAHDPSITARGYNPAKAKQLLAEAGYPNGFRTTMYVASNAPRDIAVAMQAQLAAVGIQCDLDFPQPASMFNMWTGVGWHNGVFFMTQSLWANPNGNWNLFVGEPPGWFKTTKHPDGWREMLYASFATRDPDPEHLKKLSRALHEDITFIPLTWHMGTFATSQEVHDTGYGTRGMWTWWNPQNTWLSK